MLRQQRQLLLQKLKAIRKLSPQPDYPHLHHLLSQGLIPLSTIKYHLGDRSPEWHSLSQWQIISDAVLLKKKSVEVAWVKEHLSPERLKKKKQLYNQFHSQIKGKQDLRIRMKYLRGALQTSEGDIKMAKSEDALLECQKKYQDLRGEYDYWRNRHRKMKTIHQLQSSIEPISSQVKKQLESLPLVPPESPDPSPPTQSRPQQLLKLKKIFNLYVKKNKKASRSFQQITDDQSLSLEAYCELNRDLNLNRTLSSERLLQLYKQKTGCTRHISFQLWIELIQDICQEQCTQLGLHFTSARLDQYFNRVIRVKLVSLESPYVFKVRQHTGKTAHDIKQELQRRKLSVKMRCMTQDVRNKPVVTEKPSLSLLLGSSYVKRNLLKRILNGSQVVEKGVFPTEVDLSGIVNEEEDEYLSQLRERLPGGQFKLLQRFHY